MRTRRTFLAAAVGAIGGCTTSTGGQSDTEIEFLLNWKPNGLHVPYYVAAEKGYYRAEGLSVTIQPGQGSDFSSKQVALENNSLGVTSSDQVLAVNGQGLDVTAVAAVMQRSPVVVFATRNGLGDEFTSAGQLAGKTVGVGPGMVRLLTSLFLEREGVRDDVELVRTGYDTVQQLLTGKIDAAGGVFGDAIDARHNGYTVDTVPVASAVPSYGHVLATNPSFADRNGDAVRSFLRATARGAARGRRNLDEATDALVAANESLAASRAIQRETWTTMADEFMLSDAVGSYGWGWNRSTPWTEMEGLLADSDRLGQPVDPDTVWTNAYLDTEYRYIGSYADAVHEGG